MIYLFKALIFIHTYITLSGLKLYLLEVILVELLWELGITPLEGVSVMVALVILGP